MNLLHSLSSLAVHLLNERRLHALRSAYLSARSAVSPLLKVIHGKFDAAELSRHLEARIGKDFEVLMVHSSINNMQPMFTSNPLELVKMLMAYCGPNRTLVMPAFYFGDPKIGGAYSTLEQNPRFDLRRTPSQMGLATELFRRMPGVVQSRHPVYRVAALGPLARELTTGQEFAEYPSGIGSPFDHMTRRNTRVIGIGKDIEVLTQAHHVEGVMGDDFPVPRGPAAGLVVMVVDGKEEFPVTLGGRGPIWRFNVMKLREIMDSETLSEWKFHNVPLFSVRAADVTATLVAAAKRGITLYDRP